MSIDNSEIGIVPCRQGFIGISTIHADFLVLGDFNTDLLKPHTLQEECSFSKLIFKIYYYTARLNLSAWGLTVWMLSIICTKLSNHSEEAEGFLY